MSCKIDEVIKPSKDIIAFRFVNQSGFAFNFCVQFKEKKVFFKDGFTFNGDWKEVNINGIKSTNGITITIKEKKIE